MKYSPIASSTIGDGSEFVKKIRVIPDSRFLASSSLASVPISLHTIQESQISRLVNFLPPRCRQTVHNAHKRSGPHGKLPEKSSHTIPQAGPSDFSCSFHPAETLPCIQKNAKRTHDGNASSKEATTQIMATCYRDGLVSLYDFRTNRPTAVMEDICSQKETHCVQLVDFSVDGLETSTFDPNAASRASQSYLLVGDGPSVHLVDLRKLRVVDTMDYHSDIVTDMQLLPSSMDRGPASRRMVTSSEDCSLILSDVTAAGVEYCDALALTAPLRHMCVSQRGKLLVSTSVEDVVRTAVRRGDGSDVEMHAEKSIERFSGSAYVADVFSLSGMDFSASLTSSDAIFDLTAFCIGDNEACSNEEKRNLDIFYFPRKKRNFQRLATLVDCGEAVVRSVQPVLLDGCESMAYLTGDESGAIRLWSAA